MPKVANFLGTRTSLRSHVGLLSALALVFSLLFGLGFPTQARAASNAGEFIFGTSTVVVEDIALCTKYKYPFDPSTNGGFTWNLTGYETCPSESLTTSSLPASLHIKFRIQSINPEEFLASYADAYISDSKGMKVNTPRWAPSPLVDLDGPFNSRDGRYYAAFSIADPKIFLAGTYSLTIQFWNAQWVKLNGPNIQETPKSFTPFSFTIAGGATPSQSSATTEASCGKIAPSFEESLKNSKNILDAINAKASSITDFSAPNLMSGIESMMATVKDQAANVYNISGKFYAVYKGYGFDNCPAYISFGDQFNSLEAQVAAMQAILSGYYAKAKALAGNSATEQLENANCEVQGNTALTSIKKSLAVLSVYESKSQSDFDFKSAPLLEMFNGWQDSLHAEYVNIDTWRMKLPEYLRADPKCAAYETASSWVNQGMVQYKRVSTTISNLQLKAQNSAAATERASGNQSSQEDQFVDEDGVEEEPSANLTVTFSATVSRYIIKVESNLPDDSLTIRATKKGAKPLRFTISTDEEGVGGLRTKTKLSGYTLTLYYDALKLDSVKVK